jgi:hypothetical protein
MKTDVFREYGIRGLLAGVSLSAAVTLSGCSTLMDPLKLLPEESRTKAAAMYLSRSEGTIYVLNDKARALNIRDDMSLRKGYQVDTRTNSYAWIDMDRERIVKLDEQSEVSVTADDKNLELVLDEGNLLFGISTPLDEDESLNIQTSNLSIGIRGTVGIVKAVDDEHTTLTLLEGSVECETPDHQPVTVETGQTAEITKKGDETCEVNVREIRAEDIEEFARTELDENDTLRNQVEEVLDYQSLPVTPNYENEKNYRALELYRNELETNPEFQFDVNEDIDYAATNGIPQFCLTDINQDGVYEMLVRRPVRRHDEEANFLYYMKDDMIQRIGCLRFDSFIFMENRMFAIEFGDYGVFGKYIYQFDGPEPVMIDEYYNNEDYFGRALDTLNEKNEVMLSSDSWYTEEIFRGDLEAYKKKAEYAEKPHWEYKSIEVSDESLDEYFSGAGKASEISHYSPGENLEELPEISRIIVQ